MPKELGIPWSVADNKLFESALCASAQKLGPIEPNWESFQRMDLVAGRHSWELKQRYDMLVKDVAAIEAGLVALPDYCDAGQGDDDHRHGSGPGAAATAASSARSVRRIPPPASQHHRTSDHPPQERRKGIPWTEEEHKLFLRGLEVYGKGDWRSISRHFVVTRTPTQVASHAQKYFLRLASNHKDKRRNSIHDITSALPSRPMQSH